MCLSPKWWFIHSGVPQLQQNTAKKPSASGCPALGSGLSSMSVAGKTPCHNAQKALVEFPPKMSSRWEPMLAS